MLYLSEDHKKLIRRILPKKADLRVAINGVLIERVTDGTWLVVTDTYRLFAARIAAPDDTPQGIPPFLVTKGAFAARTAEKNKIDIDGIQAGETIDAQFPQWRGVWRPNCMTEFPEVAKIFPNRQGRPSVLGGVTADLEYLADTTLVFPLVELHQEAPDKAYFWGAADDTIRYMLMPVLSGQGE